ncbi:hypothetical protein B0H13DRAFT_1154629 [Mycena leptocephala]|nr:hypothetical protein B0H13DRAFT_1154629 [Mycena leptocephala]
MEVFGKSWDDRVYTGIRQFHETKGFDPCGQDVARALGYPLFRPTCERDVLFAHLQENDASDYFSDSDGLSGEEEFWDQQSGPGDASSAQDTAIDGASRPYSTHHGQEDFLPRTNCLREIDVLNTSIVWEAAFAGDPPS